LLNSYLDCTLSDDENCVSATSVCSDGSLGERCFLDGETNSCKHEHYCVVADASKPNENICSSGELDSPCGKTDDCVSAPRCVIVDHNQPDIKKCSNGSIGSPCTPKSDDSTKTDDCSNPHDFVCHEYECCLVDCSSKCPNEDDGCGGTCASVGSLNCRIANPNYPHCLPDGNGRGSSMCTNKGSYFPCNVDADCNSDNCNNHLCNMKIP